ncbi:MAG: cellulase family glycosylhydrolase [Agathobacter sp.]|nr:cellulase family glycosylhydrolase [Agathobacter sp.]
MVKKWKKTIAIGLIAVCLVSSMSACNVRTAEAQTEKGTEDAPDTEIENGGEKENGEEAGNGAEPGTVMGMEAGTGSELNAGEEMKDAAETKAEGGSEMESNVEPGVESKAGAETGGGAGTETKAEMDINTENGDAAGSTIEAGKVRNKKNNSQKDSTEPTVSEKAGKKSESGKPLATPANSGALQVIDTQLCDKNGNPVQLRGISTHGLAWFPEYVNNALFEQFRNEWNVNVMRLAMYTDENGGYCAGGNQDELKKLVKNGVKYATDNDMYVIIDWHVLNDRDPNVHIDDAKAFFKEMSKEFAGADNVLYEICNEPNGQTSWNDIKLYADEIIPIIRKNDSDAIIIVGTPNWSQYVDQAADDSISDYDNIMYALHFYAATHKEWLRDTMTKAIDQGLPVFVTEYGICDASGNGSIDEAEANRWIETMNDYGVSYVAWNLSNKEETSSIISASCTKISDLKTSDLSDSGKWLYNMLTDKKNTIGTPNNAKRDTTADKSGKEKQSKTDSDNRKNKKDESTTNNSSRTNSSKGNSDAKTSNDWVVSATVNQNITVTATVSNEWETEGKTYHQYTVTIDNISSEKLEKWMVTIKFNEDITLENGWNGQMTVKGKMLTIEPVDYNSTIEAGASVTDIGFIVHD